MNSKPGSASLLDNATDGFIIKKLYITLTPLPSSL